MPTIPARFNGPPASGNGGWSAGVIAAYVDAPVVEVRLMAPPPLDTELRVERRDDGAYLLHGDTPIARARPGAPDLEIPPPVGYEAAVDAATRPVSDAARHPYPTCFGCGPQRAPEDAVRHIAGTVDGRDDVVACPANTSPTLPSHDGALAPETVWAGLDCPSAAATIPLDASTPYMLGTFTARLDRLVRVGEPHVVMAWGLGGEGRKRFGASAILDADGRLCAVAHAVWISVVPSSSRTPAAAPAGR